VSVHLRRGAPGATDRAVGAICEHGRVVTADEVVFRPRFGQVLTVGFAVLSGVALVVTLVQDPAAALRYAPAILLPTLLVWALFGRPAVVVHAGGVDLRNVTRTIELPWPSIRMIDTKYALTLHTDYGTYAAWAAPAPSRAQTIRAARDETANLPSSTFGPGGTVRPGDLAGSDSGQAAMYIRRRWEDLRDAGHLDDPRLERARPRVRWHVRTLLAVAALGALALLAL